MRFRFDQAQRYSDSFLVFTVTGALLFTRLISGGRELFTESLWAEDGLFALCNIKASAISCGFDSFSGYWSGLPRFLSFLVSRFPIEQWALVNNMLTLLFLSSLAAFSYSCIRSHISSKPLSYFLVIAPTILAGVTHEVLMVGNSIFGILGYYILLIFLYSDYANKPVGSKFITFCSLSLLYTVSNPLGLLLLFACLIDLYVFKSRSLNSYILTCFVLVGNIVEGIFVLINHTERDRAALDLEFWRTISFEFIKSFTLLLYSPRNSNYLSGSNLSTIIMTLFLGLFSCLILIVFLRNFKVACQHFLSDRKLLIPFFIFSSSLFVSVLTKGSTSRFEVMTSLYVIIFIAGVLQLQGRKFFSIGCILLYLFIGINGIFNFEASDYRSTGPLWSQQLENSRRICNDNPSGNFRMTFSPNWVASINHPYKVFEPTTEKIDCSVFLLQK